MDSENRHFEKPSIFNKCSLNWIISPFSRDSNNDEYFLANNVEKPQRFIFQLCPALECFYARNLYGDILFKARCPNNYYDYINIILPNEEVIGDISLEIVNQPSNNTYCVCGEADKYKYLHGPYSGSQTSTLPMFVKFIWQNNGMIIEEAIKQFSANKDEFLIALVITKAFQLILYHHRDCLWTQAVYSGMEFTWIQLPSYSSDILSSIKHMSECKLLLQRVIKNYGCNHYIMDSTIPTCHLYLGIEFYKEVEELQVFDNCKRLQFYATNISNEEGVYVFLHEFVYIGEVQITNLITSRGEVVMTAHREFSDREIDFSIVNQDGCTVCKVVSVEDGIYINVNQDLPPEYKALILVFVFRTAYTSNTFHSISNREFLPHKLYSNLNFKLYNIGNYMDKGKFRIEKTAEGAKYQILQLEAQENPVVVFNVIERPGNVQAFMYNKHRKHTYTVYGVWGMENSLIVANSEVIGVCRQDIFYNMIAEFMSVEKEKEVYKIYRIDSTTDSKKQLAVISGDKTGVDIEVFRSQTEEEFTMVVAYALKLSYNVYCMYTKP